MNPWMLSAHWWMQWRNFVEFMKFEESESMRAWMQEKAMECQAKYVMNLALELARRNV